MRYSSANKGFPAGNPIANALVVIVGALTIAASLVVGFLAVLILGAVLLVFAAIVGIRLWWFRRKMTSAPQHVRPGSSKTGNTKQTIEGEYHVVIEERED